MKIGIYDPYLDDLGGGEKYMMTIAECLSAEHDVRVFWDNSEDLRILNQRFDLNLQKVTLEKNIFSPKVSLKDRLIATRKYDVLIVLSDGSIPFVLSKKLLLHVQQPLLISIASWKTKLKQKRVHYMFYNSRFSETFNKNLFPVVPKAILYPPVELHAAKVKKENIILHVGRFRVTNVKNQDYKKQQVMVKAFKQMVDNGLKHWRFIVATSTPDVDEPRFQEMLKSAEGYPIEFLVNKSNKALWETYNKAKIYWHASGYGEDLTKHPEYAEHFGISTVEAMGAGAVPVVINAGGQREIVTEGENGLLWDTLEELQKKTKQLIEHPERWEKLSKEAQLRAKDFGKEIFCKKLYELIG